MAEMLLLPKEKEGGLELNLESFVRHGSERNKQNFVVFTEHFKMMSVIVLSAQPKLHRFSKKNPSCQLCHFVP